MYTSSEVVQNGLHFAGHAMLTEIVRGELGTRLLIRSPFQFGADVLRGAYWTFAELQFEIILIKADRLLQAF
jgi:hypothetical protein